MRGSASSPLISPSIWLELCTKNSGSINSEDENKVCNSDWLVLDDSLAYFTGQLLAMSSREVTISCKPPHDPTFRRLSELSDAPGEKKTDRRRR